MKKSLTIFLILYFSLSTFHSSVSFAEPFYFHPNLVNQVKTRVGEIENFQEKLNFINDAIFKISNIKQEKSELIIRDIEAYKKDFIWKNLNKYIATKYLNGTGSVEFLKQSKKIYQITKLKDIKADIHPNYLESLGKKISQNLELDENSNLFKLYSYVLYNVSLQDKSSFTTLDQKFSTLSTFGETQEFLTNSGYYITKFEKLKNLENINPLSKTDFNRISAKIKNEKLSPESDYVKGFFAWYAINKKILSNTSIFVNSSINHSKQSYSLSCEANSTKDLINFYLQKSGKQIDENYVLSSLPAYTGSIAKDSSGSLFWADPNEVFVGNIAGKQSTNMNKFSGYGVYSKPLLNIINSNISSYNLIAKKSSFSEDIIFESIFKGHPVVFWYLTPVIKGKGHSYETIPISWKTPTGKIINGYLGEHTGIISGFDIDNEGKITNIYYHEGKSFELQKMSFLELKQVASFFNQTIIIENKIEKVNTLVLK